MHFLFTFLHVGTLLSFISLRQPPWNMHELCLRCARSPLPSSQVQRKVNRRCLLRSVDYKEERFRRYRCFYVCPSHPFVQDHPQTSWHPQWIPTTSFFSPFALVIELCKCGIVASRSPLADSSSLTEVQVMWPARSVKNRSGPAARGAAQLPLSTSASIVWGLECTWAVKRYNQQQWSVQPCVQ